MNLEELRKRLEGYEWNDIEFKEAKREVPRDAYETVSAFANTSGGWLVFGVKQHNTGVLEIAGVIAVDKVQNDFLTTLRSIEKFNRVIECREDLKKIEENTLLIFHIPEALRQDKPIFLNGDIRRSFIRSGAGDQKCSQVEIERFLRDASANRYDGQIIELDLEKCFDVKTIEWYRAVFNSKNPAHDTEVLDNLEFLQHWGLIVEQNNQLHPTKASILLFGTTAALLQILPRPVVDCQWHNVPADNIPMEERWSDRFLSEVNLIHTWRELLNFYQRHAQTPFALESSTLQRTNLPPDYIAFREATINLLMHQDYGDHNRKASISFFQDEMNFWNPGDAFDHVEQLLESGEREVRNPRIVAAFRRIGLSEQAGTGIRAIYRNWTQLGNLPPDVKNNKSEKFFHLTLLKVPLFSDEQLQFQANIGVVLSNDEAAIFALACQRAKITVQEVQALRQLSRADAEAVLNRLVTQVLIEPIEGTSQRIYQAAERFKDRFGPVDSEHFGQPANVSLRQLTPLNDIQWKIIRFCDVPRSKTQIRNHLELTQYMFNKKNYLDPLVDDGVLKIENPDSPGKRRYKLTDAGLRLMLNRYNRDIEANSRGSA